MKQQSKKVVFFFLVFLFFLVLFSRSDFIGPDEPIYYAYTESIVEDFDLNVVNNIARPQGYFFPNNEMWLSKTFNLPDFHNHGSVILWGPAYLYGKTVYAFLKKNGFIDSAVTSKEFLNCALSMVTVLVTFLTLFFSYVLGRLFFQDNTVFVAILTIFFGTPVFFFSLFHVGNANSVAMLFSAIFIFCSIIIVKTKNRMKFFLLGVLFSICVFIKVDLWFQIFFIVFLYTIYLFKKETNIKCGFCFILGFVPGFLMKFVNDAIKYGGGYMGEFSLLNYRDCYFFEQLFSSYRGFFYTSPIFYICIFSGFALLWRLIKKQKKENYFDLNSQLNDKNIVFLGLFLLVIIKIIFLGQRFAWGGGTCGARPLVSEFPIFVLFYADLFTRLKRKPFNILFMVLSGLFVFWNLLVVAEFISQVSMAYMIAPPRLDERLVHFNSYKHLLLPGDFSVRFFCYFFPVSLLVVSLRGLNGKYNIIGISSTSFKKKKFDKYYLFFVFFVVYCLLAYFLVTTINLRNNQRNVERMKQNDFFKNVKIISKKDCAKNENILSLKEMIRFFSLKKDFKRVENIKNNMEKILTETEVRNNHL